MVTYKETSIELSPRFKQFLHNSTYDLLGRQASIFEWTEVLSSDKKFREDFPDLYKSLYFNSTAEVTLRNMKKYPIKVTVYQDQIFLSYFILEGISDNGIIFPLSAASYYPRDYIVFVGNRTDNFVVSDIEEWIDAYFSSGSFKALRLLTPNQLNEFIKYAYWTYDPSATISAKSTKEYFEKFINILKEQPISSDVCLLRVALLRMKELDEIKSSRSSGVLSLDDPATKRSLMSSCISFLKTLIGYPTDLSSLIYTFFKIFTDKPYAIVGVSERGVLGNKYETVLGEFIPRTEQARLRSTSTSSKISKSELILLRTLAFFRENYDLALMYDESNGWETLDPTTLNYPSATSLSLVDNTPSKFSKSVEDLINLGFSEVDVLDKNTVITAVRRAVGAGLKRIQRSPSELNLTGLTPIITDRLIEDLSVIGASWQRSVPKPTYVIESLRELFMRESVKSDILYKLLSSF